MRDGLHGPDLPELRVVFNLREGEDVNVDDVAVVEDQPECRLKALFEYQVELMDRYRDVEVRNEIGLGLLPETFDLDDRRCQYVLKDYAWRVMEEVGEALAVLPEDGLTQHAKEEIADGLHFLVELLHMAGIGPDGIVIEHGRDRLEYLFKKSLAHGPASPIEELIRDLGMAMNCLKNKPWKQTQFPTDVGRFQGLLVQAFTSYVGFAYSWGMTSDSLYDMYVRKRTVNHFRIDSNY